MTQGAEAGTGPTPQPERTPGTGEGLPKHERPRGATSPAAGQHPQEPMAATSDVTFPQIARLELDDLLEQLVERAASIDVTSASTPSIAFSTTPNSE